MGYTIFTASVNKWGKFVTDQTPKSCVDEKESAVEHAMDAMHSAMKIPAVKSFIDSYTDKIHDELSADELGPILQSRSSYRLAEIMCCKKEAHPDLCYDATDTSEKVHMHTPLRCTHGTDHTGKVKCNACGIEKRLRLLRNMKCNLSQEVLDTPCAVKVWKDARRQGVNKKTNKANMQRELTSTTMSFGDLITHFIDTTSVYVRHYGEIVWTCRQWKNQQRNLPRDTLIIQTDFAATPNLTATEKLNSATDSHAVIDNFVCLYGREDVTVTDKENGHTETVVVFTVDVHHFLAETFSKGKKNDHAMHNACLDALIKHYKSVWVERFGVELRVVIVRTDNAPHQYRCRHAIMYVAMSDIIIMHYLAVPSQFKGTHDQVGKDLKWLITKLEADGIRSPDAFTAFTNCIEEGYEKRYGDTEWKEYKDDGDVRLKNKGTFGMDTRTVWFAAESTHDQHVLEDMYPKLTGRIIVCDRENKLDTHDGKTAFAGTAQLRHFSTAKHTMSAEELNVRPDEFPVKLSNLFCECVHCRLDHNNTQCAYRPWMNARTEWMKPNSVSSESKVEEGIEL